MRAATRQPCRWRCTYLYNSMTRNDDAEWGSAKDAVLQELEIAPQDLEEFEFSVRDALRQRGE